MGFHVHQEAGREAGLSFDRTADLISFQSANKFSFKSLKLLNSCLTHRSCSNEKIELHDNNERLEFLGDSVLGLVIASHLFKTLTDRSEGDLAKIKSFVVSEESLSEVALGLGLDQVLLLGRGEEVTGGRYKKAILADALEALIGGLFLDQGMEICEAWVLDLFKPQVAKVLEEKHRRDFKTLLQELVHKTIKDYPKYILVAKTGREHEMIFSVDVEVQGRVLGRGTGRSKKAAEQLAAQEAYGVLSQESAKP